MVSNFRYAIPSIPVTCGVWGGTGFPRSKFYFPGCQQAPGREEILLKKRKFTKNSQQFLEFSPI
jgi:hypothetical protein